MTEKGAGCRGVSLVVRIYHIDVNLPGSQNLGKRLTTRAISLIFKALSSLFEDYLFGACD